MAVNSVCCVNKFGEADDWVEIHNYGLLPVDIGGMYLTDDLTNPTRVRISDSESSRTTILRGYYKVVWLEGEFNDPRDHIPFALDGDGEQIGLYAADGHTPVDTLTFGRQSVDVSFGRVPGTDDWRFFAEPTPGSANTTAAAIGYAEAPLVSQRAGFYDSPLSVRLSTTQPDAYIYFTTDGSDPIEADSLLAVGPIAVDTTTILRARTFAEGFTPSAIATRSYLFHESFELPTLSLVTHPPNLWDWETGIYVPGPNVAPDAESPYLAANYWRSWTRPAHVEFFDEGKVLGFSTDAMIGIAGHRQTRPGPKKTFSLQIRSPHGKSQIVYPLFPDKPIERFSNLTLRGGGDWTRLKNEVIYEINALMQSTVDMQAYRPLALMLNGEYWGVYNLTENKGAEFIDNNFGISSEVVPGIRTVC
jgi:hypothetical protein